MSDTTPASTPSFDEVPAVQTDDGLGDESALPENYEDARVVDDPGADADPDVEPTLRP
ncbi:hypothetical protein [Glaciihabitans sp. dw_435]|uniref:hypothetical protein n=1 Tax=Glaciihabitans sp. dw_435 TaxID=2720081 RepID=UPI001BD39014|nr:hypothetical protein [Glaciihabitans sp. dw_435]